MHGANRLASNSLLEALVFAQRCYLKSLALLGNIQAPKNIPNWNDAGTTNPKELILITHNRHELQVLMNDYVGIIRSDERLERAAKRLQIIFEETETLYKKSVISPQLIELRNMIDVASIIISQSQQRKENKGAFYKLGI
ncbi:MAG: hypothetical protein COV50_09305 [Flavobacteriales bacterium CG11_big_fil_rev_8_21_14_0_20_35_7]|nr:MAG: hypothetical protein COV50_09305 [Flavobacteriales bacterium CG11_big_fil_rev_8_21_14_0_20_35_7]